MSVNNVNGTQPKLYTFAEMGYYTAPAMQTPTAPQTADTVEITSEKPKKKVSKGVIGAIVGVAVAALAAFGLAKTGKNISGSEKLFTFANIQAGFGKLISIPGEWFSKLKNKGEAPAPGPKGEPVPGPKGEPVPGPKGEAPAPKHEAPAASVTPAPAKGEGPTASAAPAPKSEPAPAPSAAPAPAPSVAPAASVTPAAPKSEGPTASAAPAPAASAAPAPAPAAPAPAPEKIVSSARIQGNDALKARVAGIEAKAASGKYDTLPLGYSPELADTSGEVLKALEGLKPETIEQLDDVVVCNVLMRTQPKVSSAECQKQLDALHDEIQKAKAEGLKDKAGELQKSAMSIMRQLRYAEDVSETASRIGVLEQVFTPEELTKISKSNELNYLLTSWLRVENTDSITGKTVQEIIANDEIIGAIKVRL